MRQLQVGQEAQTKHLSSNEESSAFPLKDCSEPTILALVGTQNKTPTCSSALDLTKPPRKGQILFWDFNTRALWLLWLSETFFYSPHFHCLNPNRSYPPTLAKTICSQATALNFSFWTHRSCCFTAEWSQVSSASLPICRFGWLSQACHHQPLCHTPLGPFGLACAVAP